MSLKSKRFWYWLSWFSVGLIAIIWFLFYPLMVLFTPWGGFFAVCLLIAAWGWKASKMAEKKYSLQKAPSASSEMLYREHSPNH